MITPHKVHSILRKAGIERQQYTSKLFYRIEGLPPIEMQLDGDSAIRIRIRKALEEAGVKIKLQVWRCLAVDLEQEIKEPTPTQ